MRLTALALAIVMAGVVLGANVYNSVVDAPNWGRDIPASLLTSKQYFSARNPGTFYRVASPLLQVTTLLAAILCWPIAGATRWLAVSALAIAVFGDVMTFAFFYPRNAVMFIHPVDAAAMQRAWSEWSAMNHIRSLVVVLVMMCELAVFARAARLN